MSSLFFVSLRSKKYPIVWQGLTKPQKSDTAAVQLPPSLATASWPLDSPSERRAPLRIAQRMRLEASQLERGCPEG